MDAYVAGQIRYGLRYLPGNLVKSFFIAKETTETAALRKKGFMRGVTHPMEQFERLSDAAINWVRFDVPFPFAADGSLREAYLRFKERAALYRAHHISLMAVTPVPEAFLQNGIDPRTAEGKEKIKEIAVFLAKDLQGLAAAFQIANEMGLPRFTLPLTTEEAIAFLGIQMEAMAPYKGDILIGYNSAGPEALLHSGMRKYREYFDYVGIDIYLGCFYAYPGLMCLFDAMLRYLWGMVHKPVVIAEFGYIGGGRPKCRKERRAVLQGYGVRSEREAGADMETFIRRLPREMRQALQHDGGYDPSNYYDLLFHGDLRQHFYREMRSTAKIPGYDHTPAGQAKFYGDTLQRFYDLPFVVGTFIFSYFDAPYCYVCGQKDCPMETKWGLVDRDGAPKPAYDTVRRLYRRLRFFDHTEHQQ